MELRESISHYLPVGHDDEGALEAMKVALQDRGYPFEASAGALMLRGRYEGEGRFLAVREVLKRLSPAGETFHSVSPEYDDSDYDRADFIYVYPPEVSVKGATIRRTCPVCRHREEVINPQRKVARFRVRKPVLGLGAGPKIVSKQARQAIADAGLTGAVFEPFDEGRTYFVLGARTGLGDMAVAPEDVLDYRGKCSVCGRNQFRRFHGPKRFLRENWSGDDIVYEAAIRRTLMFTQRAAKFLMGMDRRIERGEPAFLISSKEKDTRDWLSFPRVEEEPERSAPDRPKSRP